MDPTMTAAAEWSVQQAATLALYFVVVGFIGLLVSVGVVFFAYAITRTWSGVSQGFDQSANNGFDERLVTAHLVGAWATITGVLASIWGSLRSLFSRVLGFVRNNWLLFLIFLLLVPAILLWDTWHNFLLEALHKVYACTLGPVLRPILLTPANLLRIVLDAVMPIINGLIRLYRFLFYGPFYQILRCAFDTVLLVLQGIGNSAVETVRVIALWLGNQPLTEHIELFEAGKSWGATIASVENIFTCLCASLAPLWGIVFQPFRGDNFAQTFNSTINVVPLAVTQGLLNPVVGTLRNIDANGGEFTLDQVILPTLNPAFDTACVAIESGYAVVDEGLALFYEEFIEAIIELAGLVDPDSPKPPGPLDPGGPGLPPPLLQCWAKFFICGFTIEPPKYLFNVVFSLPTIITSAEGNDIWSIRPIFDKQLEGIECFCQWIKWFGDTLIYIGDLITFEERGGAAQFPPVVACSNFQDQNSCFEPAQVNVGCDTETCCRMVCTTPGFQFCCGNGWTQQCVDKAEELCQSFFRGAFLFFANLFEQLCCAWRQWATTWRGFWIVVQELISGTFYSILEQAGVFDVFRDDTNYWQVTNRPYLGGTEPTDEPYLWCGLETEDFLGGCGYGNRWSTCATKHIGPFNGDFDSVFDDISNKQFDVGSPEERDGKDFTVYEVSVDGGQTWLIPPVRIMPGLNENNNFADLTPYLSDPAADVSVRFRFQSSDSLSDEDALDTDGAFRLIQYKFQRFNGTEKVFEYVADFSQPNADGWEFSACAPTRGPIDFLRYAKFYWGNETAEIPNLYNETLIEPGVQFFKCLGDIVGNLCDECEAVTCLFEKVARAAGNIVLFVIDFVVHIGEIFQEDSYFKNLSFDAVFDSLLEAGRCMRDAIWQAALPSTDCAAAIDANGQRGSANFFCCLGELFQSLFELLVGIARPIINAIFVIIDLIAGIPVDEGVLETLNFEQALNATETLIYDGLCITLAQAIPEDLPCQDYSVFPPNSNCTADPQVPNEFGARLSVTRSVTRIIFGIFLTVYRVIIGFVSFLIETLRQASSSGGFDLDFSAIIKEVLQPIADGFVDIFRAFGELLGCIAGSDVADVFNDISCVLDQISGIGIELISNFIAFVILLIIGFIQLIVTGFQDASILLEAINQFFEFVRLFFCALLTDVACVLESIICFFGGAALCEFDDTDQFCPGSSETCNPRRPAAATCGGEQEFPCSLANGVGAELCAPRFPKFDVTGLECCGFRYDYACSFHPLNVPLDYPEYDFTIFNDECAVMGPDVTCIFPEGICGKDDSGDCCTARNPLEFDVREFSKRGGCKETSCCRCVSAFDPSCTTLWDASCVSIAYDQSTCGPFCSCSGPPPIDECEAAGDCCTGGQGCGNKPECCRSVLNYRYRSDVFNDTMGTTHNPQSYLSCARNFEDNPICTATSSEAWPQFECQCAKKKKKRNVEEELLQKKAREAANFKNYPPLPEGLQEPGFLSLFSTIRRNMDLTPEQVKQKFKGFYAQGEVPHGDAVVISSTSRIASSLAGKVEVGIDKFKTMWASSAVSGPRHKSQLKRKLKTTGEGMSKIYSLWTENNIVHHAFNAPYTLYSRIQKHKQRKLNKKQMVSSHPSNYQLFDSWRRVIQSVKNRVTTTVSSWKNGQPPQPQSKKRQVSASEAPEALTDFFGEPFECDPETVGFCLNCTVVDEYIAVSVDTAECLFEYYPERWPVVLDKFEEANHNVLIDPIGNDTFLTRNKRTPFILDGIFDVHWPWLWDYSEFLAIVHGPNGNGTNTIEDHPFTGTLISLQENRAAAQNRTDLDVQAIGVLEQVFPNVIPFLEDVAYTLVSIVNPAGDVIIRLFERYIECDYDTLLKCEDAGGIGLYDALIIVLALFALVSLLSVLVLPCIPTTLITLVLIALFPVLVVWIGYGSNPLCTVRAFPTPTTAFPSCWADDAYDLVSAVLPQCTPIPVDLILADQPGAGDLCAACSSLPPVAHCCTKSSMCDGLDNILYIVERLFPGTNEGLASNPLFTAVPILGQRVSLWTTQRIETDLSGFQTCNLITIFNILPAVFILLLTLTGLLIAGAFLGVLLFSLFIFFLAMLTAANEMVTQMDQGFINQF